MSDNIIDAKDSFSYSEDKNGQMSMFSSAAENAGKLECVRVEYKENTQFLPKELFSGYDSICAITFSYNTNTLEWIMKLGYKEAKVILGATFLVDKDYKNTNELVDAMAASDAGKKSISGCSYLLDMMEKGLLSVRTSSTILDHRKIYILKADDGRSRVIITSANLSKSALVNPTQIEFYTYDETAGGYEFWLSRFDSAWDLAEPLPYESVMSNETSDPIKDNVILSNISKEPDKAIILKDTSTDDQIQVKRFVIEQSEQAQRYARLLKGSGKDISRKNGNIIYKPGILKVIEKNLRQEKIKKSTILETSESYPQLTFSQEGYQALLNGKVLDTSPTDEEVRQNIEHIFEVFDRFNEFVTDSVPDLQYTYFMLLNAMFVSPFNAPVRCASYMAEKSTSSLPLFLLISSESGNSGKTFMIKTILKMMTGINNLPAFSSVDFRKAEIINAQQSCKGIPVFVDEIDNRYLTSLSSVIKNSDRICEVVQNNTVPMIIFASNDVISPDEKLRKRMIFLRPDGVVPSTADQSMWDSVGMAERRNLGNAFYRRYLELMMHTVEDDFIDRLMYHNEDVPDDWYPDLMQVSSDCIIKIINDAGLQCPDYVRQLKWNEDYSTHAKGTYDKALKEIETLYQNNSKIFTVTKDTVRITLGNDARKQAKSLKSMLPAEILKHYSQGRDGTELVLDRNALKGQGYDFGKGLLSFFRRKR
ncbi:MAG: hypothetical protein PUG04_02795 [Lachnospiraceae bacterium]|nr:hypothetical protein [Lachnospiraceae bacterium]